MLPFKRIRPRPPKHDRTDQINEERRTPMTICIASMFAWNYGAKDSTDLKDIGKAIITMSDRQMTAGDVEYEPMHLKMSFVTPRVIVLVAGDLPTHSEALSRMLDQLRAVPEANPGVIAEMYAAFIREIKFRYAVQKYLGPLGLDQESFYASQKNFAPDFRTRLTNQLQSYDAPATEAIIAGTDGRTLQIWVMDEESKISNHTDVGFAAIGIGAWHAKSAMMHARYSHIFPFATALALTYAAKKRSEIAPGVGQETDIYLITKAGWEPLRQELKSKLLEAYKEFEHELNKLTETTIKGIGGSP
jgi:hypothetical protein